MRIHRFGRDQRPPVASRPRRDRDGRFGGAAKSIGHSIALACCCAFSGWFAAAAPGFAEDSPRSTEAETTVSPTGESQQVSPVTGINVPAGFSVERVAGPPLVQHPTMACFDDRGRLFVCESAGLNLDADELEDRKPNSIRLLEDRDADGRFDHATLFADKMTFPMGAAWHEGALYVASPPNIWRLEDTDEDGVADRREILVDRFGFTGNAASVHGCFLAPDGRLYWCDGYHGHEFRDEEGEIVSKRVGSYIFSCRPDGSDVQIHAGGGMDNPVEVDFTAAGDVLGTVNILYTRPRVDALVHWLYGGAYPHRRQVLEELKITGDLLGPVHRFGHVAVSGMVRSRSGVFDANGRDNYFATFFNGGQVVRLELAPRGSTFEATQRPFLSSTNRDFHPTDVLEDADGSLLVIDTGGWFYRGCPTSQYSKPDVLGGIYRVRRDDAVTPQDAWGRAIDWSGLNASQCIRLAGDARYRVRERAIAELARRGPETIPALRQTLQRDDEANAGLRLAAVWALTRVVQENEMASETDDVGARDAALTAIRSALGDRDATVRQASCHSLAIHRDGEATAYLMALLRSEEHPSVRRVAAKALGRIGDPRAVPCLLGGFERAVDQAERHALTYALIEIGDPQATKQALAGLEAKQLAGRAATVQGALNALDQMDRGQVDGALVVSLLDADDPSLRKTALRIVQSRPEWSPLAAAKLDALLESAERTADETTERPELLKDLVVALIAEPAVQERIGRILGEASPSTTDSLPRLLLEAIAKSRLPDLPARWREPLRRLLQSNDEETLPLVVGAVASIATDEFDDLLSAIGRDERQTATLRVAAYEAISGRGNELSPELFALLIEMLGPSGTPAEAARASRTIAAASLTEAQLQQLLPQLQQAGPMQLSQLMTPFARVRKPELGQAFLETLQRAPSFPGLDPTTLSETIKRYPPELLPQANRMLASLQADQQRKIARLDVLVPLVEEADAERGEKLFFSESAKCSSCHRVGQRGGMIGPDLTTIGANRSIIALLESTVFPSASIVRDYEPCKVLTVDGRLLTGMIVDQTAETVIVQQQTGEPLELARAEIESIDTSAVSLMPSGLEEALTEQQLADIVAYLTTLR